MELDLQKKLNDEQKKRPLRGSENLDQPIETLRMTYIQKSKEQEQKIRDLERSLADLNFQLGHEKKKVESLGERLQEKEESFKREDVQERQILIKNLVHKESEVEQLKVKLAAQTEYEGKLKEDIERMGEEKASLLQQMQNMDEKKVELESLVKQMEIEKDNAIRGIDELSKGDGVPVDKEKVLVLEKRVDELVAENKTMLFENKKLHLKVDEISHVRDNLNNKISQDYLPNIVELESKLGNTESEMEVVKGKNDELTYRVGELEREKAVHSGKMLPINQQVEDLKLMVEKLKEKNMGMGNDVATMQAQLRASQSMNEKNEIEMENLRQFIKAEEVKTQRGRIEGRTNLQKFLEAEEIVKKLNAKLEAQNQTILALEGENDGLKKKLTIQNLVESLNQTDLSSLVKINQDVSGKVSSLLGMLKD